MTSPSGPVPAGALSPAERERAVTALGAHFAADELTIDEYERRCAAVYAARSRAELLALLADVPGAGALTVAPAATGLTPIAPEGRIVAVLSNVERRGGVSVPLRLEIKSTLGNIELDLRDACFSAGITELDIHAVFGNVEIDLPAGTRVENAGRALFGSFAAQGGGAGGVVVHLTGAALFGNIEIRVASP